MGKDYGRIDVLDKGYVIMKDKLGSDLTPVNAARVSYDKETDTMRPQDERLIRFLSEHGHTSPFRHATLQFEIYAPLMVARQWFKYVIGSAHMEGTGDSLDAWNESSRRYITELPTFYVPDATEWRSAPENSKQGSGAPLSVEEGMKWSMELLDYIEEGERLYNDALARGIAAEQARLFLPAYGLYVRWYWTASLQSVAHFVHQRVADDAQKEIQDYARAVDTLARAQYPVAMGALIG